MSIDPFTLQSENGWEPENILRYCADNDLCQLSEFDAEELCQILKTCPIVEFRKIVVESGEDLFFCVLKNECQELFDLKHKLKLRDFSNISILFEEETASPYIDFGGKICYLEPVCCESEDYYELFNEVLVVFVSSL